MRTPLPTAPCCRWRQNKALNSILSTCRYLAHPDGHTLKIWLESPEIGFPIKPDNYHCSEPKVLANACVCLCLLVFACVCLCLLVFACVCLCLLAAPRPACCGCCFAASLLLQVFPADCREAGTSYTAPLHCTVCSQCVLFFVVIPRFLDAGANRYDDFPPVRVPKTITQIPIMVKSKRCNTCVRPALPILRYAKLNSVPPADTASRPPPTLPLVPSQSLSFSNLLSALVQFVTFCCRRGSQ